MKNSLLGTIRYIPENSDSEGTNGTQTKPNHKPKRNGNDSESDDEIANLTSEPRVNGHGHHRSSRKKSKSVRMNR